MVRVLKTEKLEESMATDDMLSTKTESEKPTRSLWREGLPGWVWPALVTIYALTERTLGSFGIKRFFEMATSPSNWLPEFLLISLTGTLGWKSVKIINSRIERKDEQQSARNIEGS